MRIHLLCDQKWRDMPNLTALAMRLRARGHTALVSTTRDARAMIDAFAPDCVVLNHLLSPMTQALALDLREAGIAVAVLPTEGAGRPELDGLVNGEFAGEWAMDLYLAWSETAAEGLRRFRGLSGDVVRAIGCSRLDFYAPSWSAAVTPRDAFCRRYGLDPARPIVTWASAYAFAEALNDAEYRRKFLAEAEANGLAASYRRLGFHDMRLPEIHAEGRNKCTAAVMALAQARPDWQIVVRPHPVERREFYEREIAARGLANVRFAPSDYIWNILNASDLHLHRHCTTAVEAWMWDKPTIEMGMDNVPEMPWAEREEGSDIAHDADSLIALADRAIAGASKDPARSAYRRAYVERWFGAADGKRCAAAADALDALVRAHGPARGALRTGRRSVWPARWRHFWGKLPTAPLIGPTDRRALDPMDRWATSKDVRAYERLLAGTPAAAS